MELKVENNLINKINYLCINWVIPFMIVIMLCCGTIVNDFLFGKLELIQNLIIIFFILVATYNILYKGKNGIIEYFKLNKIIIIYFIFRGISFVSQGFSYSIIRSVIIEMLFIFAIGVINVTGKDLKRYLNIFIYLILFFNITSLVIYYVTPVVEEPIYSFIQNHTLYNTSPTASISNPNFLGTFTAFAIIIVLSMIIKTRNKLYRYLGIFYILFNLYFLYLQECRSAEVGILAIILSFVLLKRSIKFDKKRVISMWIILVLSFVGCIYCFTYVHIDNTKALSDLEYQINDLGASRYAVWKTCIIEQQNHQLTGAGSLSLERSSRKAIFTDDKYDYQLVHKGAVWGPHNGYICAISVTGWIGFALLMLIILKKIKKSTALNSGPWCYLIIYILVINMFENFFIFDSYRLIFALFLFMMLNMKEDEESDKLLSC